MIRAKSALTRFFKKIAAGVLFFVPQGLLVRLLPAGWRFDPRATGEVTEPHPGARRVLVGPANAAGQSWAIARALERRFADVGAVAVSATPNAHFNFPADYRVPIGAYHWSKAWQRREREVVESQFTHVLIESGRRIFGDGFPGSPLREIAELRAHGVGVGLLFYGSDIRLPSRHAAGSPWSPFRGRMWDLTPQLERIAARNARLAAKAGCPTFVTTPDMLLDLPDATWLPLIVDTDAWATSSTPLSGTGLPRVAHAPTSSAVKGSDVVDPILRKLEAEGLLEYVRVSGIPADEMRSVYQGVDIVLDQFRMGIYGVSACEAMAAGRILISHVGEFTRDYVTELTGRTLPVVEATLETLEDVIRLVLESPEPYLKLAADGVDYARALHDGTRSAEVLSALLSE